MIRPWIVRGYDNDSRQQRLYFFDNGYGASVIPEVENDGFQVVQIEQTEESSFPGMSYRNSFESGSMSVNYGIMSRTRKPYRMCFRRFVLLDDTNIHSVYSSIARGR